MSENQALTCWEGLSMLAGERTLVHLTGGEPFLNYPRLARILQLSSEKGLRGLEKVETNASWCKNEQTVREKLEKLQEFGLTTLQFSTDAYHQEFIPLEQVKLGVKVAAEVLGQDNVRVRWQEDLQNGTGWGLLSPDEIIRNALNKRPERLLGRGADKLAGLFPLRCYKDFTDENCRSSLLGSRHVHIDGMGNVFPGTCVGIILGRLNDNPDSLAELWRRFDYRQHPVVSTLAEKGPVGLLKEAQNIGYRTAEGYASKCHLCYEVRSFLRKNDRYKKYLGPSVCYGECERDGEKQKNINRNKVHA